MRRRCQSYPAVVLAVLMILRSAWGVVNPQSVETSVSILKLADRAGLQVLFFLPGFHLNSINLIPAHPF